MAEQPRVATADEGRMAVPAEADRA
jgi:hypothetical protein